MRDFIQDMGETIRVGDFVYDKEMVSKAAHSANIIGLNRLNTRTGQYENYNPQSEGPFSPSHRR